MRTVKQIYLTFTDFMTGQKTRECGQIDENSRLLGNPVCVDFGNEKYLKNDTIGNYEYYAADPLWIKIRLLLFWIFWGALLAIIILSILTYSCLVPSLCSNYPDSSF